MAYDRWDWHSGGTYPKDLDDEAAATHIGMYVAWAYSAGLLGEFHTEDCPEDAEEFEQRSITPGQWLLKYCDGKFTNEDLNEEGNRFTSVYYDTESEPSYYDDYATAFNVPEDRDLDIYRVPDTWKSFETIKPVLDKRLAQWRKTGG